MYKFYYDFVKKKCKNPILLFTDTNSWCSETEKTFYEILIKHEELFDLSNFPKDSEYSRNAKKKYQEKRKMNMEEQFIGPKPKMYSIRNVNNCEKSVHKGHNSNIGHDEFKDALINKKVIRHYMKGNKPFNHRMYTYKGNKISLSGFDNKRYILKDGINTLAYGHEDIPK